MKEDEFLELLENRAKQEKEIMQSGILPEWASFLGDWFGMNPWRVIGLGSSVVYVVGRLVGGVGWRDWILKIFGGY